ncbi:MAG: hypothetical protein JW929_01190 [Anaerolineales bacterium]|nr:hypothetical protein [Anaerolineales bacterium]
MAPADYFKHVTLPWDSAAEKLDVIERPLFGNSAEALRPAEIGASCPDRFLRTKIKPLFVD